MFISRFRRNSPDTLHRTPRASPVSPWRRSLPRVYDQEKLTTFQARSLLGIQSRYEMDGFLKAHGVYLDLTLEDVRKETDAAIAPAR